jgi:hypothetical protein
MMSHTLVVKKCKKKEAKSKMNIKIRDLQSGLEKVRWQIRSTKMRYSSIKIKRILLNN